MGLTLSIVPGTFAICRLERAASIPEWAHIGFFSTVRTPDELSIVCKEEIVPEGVLCEKGWYCLKVRGPLDFVLTGILASLAVPLAEAGISIFAISTYDTDYFLVKE
ncbi:MAG TPA: ACT domain-containing protein, partial [Anaerolineae bacterium]